MASSKSLPRPAAVILLRMRWIIVATSGTQVRRSVGRADDDSDRSLNSREADMKVLDRKYVV
jgi:hypothetical protein